MYDGQRPRPAAAESQLAVGNNRGEGVGTYDRRSCDAIGFRLKGRSTERQREGITQYEKCEAWSHLTPERTCKDSHKSGGAAPTIQRIPCQVQRSLGRRSG